MSKKGQLHKSTKGPEILRVHKGQRLCALRDFVVKSFGEPMKLFPLQILKRRLTPLKFCLIVVVIILNLAKKAIDDGDKELAVICIVVALIVTLLGTTVEMISKLMLWLKKTS